MPPSRHSPVRNTNVRLLLWRMPRKSDKERAQRRELHQTLHNSLCSRMCKDVVTVRLSPLFAFGVYQWRAHTARVRSKPFYPISDLWLLLPTMAASSNFWASISLRTLCLSSSVTASFIMRACSSSSHHFFFLHYSMLRLGADFQQLRGLVFMFVDIFSHKSDFSVGALCFF